MKKKVFMSTIATGLVISSLSAAPVNTLSYGNFSFVSTVKAETDSLDTLISRMKSVYQAVSANAFDKKAVDASRNKLKSLTEAEWESIVSAKIINHIKTKIKSENTKEVLEMVREMASIFYATDENMSVNLQNFLKKYSDELQVLFKDPDTLTQMFSFINALQNEMMKQVAFAVVVDSDTDIEAIIKNATLTVIATDEFKDLNDKLKAGFGTDIDGIIAMNDRINAIIDPDNSARDALIRGAVSARGGAIKGNAAITLGSVESYKFEIPFEGTPIDMSSSVTWSIEKGTGSAGLKGSTLSADSVGTVTIKAVVLNNIVIAQKVININSVIAGDNVQYQNVKVTPKVTESNGKAVVTLDNDTAIKSVNANKDPKNIEIAVGNKTNAAVLLVDHTLISQVAKNNTYSKISFHTNLGKVTLPIGLLNNALSQGDTNTQLEFTIELSATQPSDDSLLATPIVTNLAVIKDGERSSVPSFSGYVSTTVSIDGTYNANEIAVKEQLSDKEFLPVPTLTVSADGKTEITMKLRRNGTFYVVQHTNSFSDVDATHWAKPQIGLLASRYVISGNDDGKFNPDASLTRAEMATLIVRALGLTPNVAASNFVDVKSDDWFAGTIGSAAQAGLIVGNNNAFRPHDKVTRQEASVMLMNAVHFVGGEVAMTGQEQTDLFAKYKDHNKIGSWAKVQMAKAIKIKLLNGNNSEELIPTAYTTRAEAVAMVKSLMQTVGLINTDSR